MAESSDASISANAPRGVLAWVGQIALYGLFALAIGVFSHWPTYHHLDADQALIKVSFLHTSKPVGDCRVLDADELARLPPNMRRPVVCPRERSPVTIEVDLDGEPFVRATAQPAGLSSDGAAALYRRLVVGAGERRIAVRLSDDVRAPDFTHRLDTTVTLVPAQVLVIDFDADGGGITIQ